MTYKADPNGTNTIVPANDDAKAEAPRVEAEAEVVNENPTSSDDGDVEEDDEEDDEEDGESPDLPNVGNDLDDDDDEDDDDKFTIQYQRPTGATKGVALKDSASQGVQREKEASQEKHQVEKKKVLLEKAILSCGDFDFLTEDGRLEALKAEEELELQIKQTEDSLKLAKSLATKVLPRKKSTKTVNVVQAQAKLLSIAEVEHEKNLKLAE
ncbi:pheromone-processing carboxypeptidase KEX1-like [Cynara cardunculus var. scolymus]|uniref:pheromone-processing carboxypeptidase KEX1-like n=1 Tax=Cynara cardunculus var. scolymus TaxID=59895 RepID=UPI000D62B1C3|nr:pheromone-processing carboxypeptidase KEX1-like [Cynara cardunculus var. scolymus]